MTAREKFKIGDRVKLTALGAKQSSLSRTPTGFVTGFSTAYDSVIVKRDGRKIAIACSPDFWEVDAAPSPSEPTGWISGPPPGAGRYWVIWKGWPETRVEPVELSPALIYRGDPNAPLQIKTLSGCAYRLEDNRHDLTHHMPFVAPEPPQ